MLHSGFTSILSSILMLVLVLVLYSFGEFRSISFAFAHLLIKWPTTLQVPAASVASCCCELLLLLYCCCCRCRSCCHLAFGIAWSRPAGISPWPSWWSPEVLETHAGQDSLPDKFKSVLRSSVSAVNHAQQIPALASRSNKAAHKSHNGNLIQ